MNLDQYTEITACEKEVARLTAKIQTRGFDGQNADALALAEVRLEEARLAADPRYVPAPSFQRKLRRLGLCPE